MTESPSSSQAGYLLPSPGLFRFQFGVAGQGLGQGYWPGPEPLDGVPLDDFLQALAVGITGLDPTRVIDRWQDEPPNFPADVEWAAVGVTESEPDPGWAYVFHDGAHSGRDYVQQHEVVTLLVSTYGPRADLYDGLLRDGLQVSQNREILQLTAMGLLTTGAATVAPRLLGMRWRRRIDRRYRIRRLIRRSYPVLNILSVPISATAETQGGTVLTASRSVASPSTT